MKVYCYFEPAADWMDPILSRWFRSWNAAGWKPRILTLRHIKDSSEYVKRVEQYPTVNPMPYTLCRYLRWMAIRDVGGGLLTDCDLINYGFKPEDLVHKSDIAVYDQAIRTGCVYITEEGAQQYLDWVIEAGDRPELVGEWEGEPHIDDCAILQAHKDKVGLVSTKLEFPKNDDGSTDQCKDAQLIHYTWVSCYKFHGIKDNIKLTVADRIEQKFGLPISKYGI